MAVMKVLRWNLKVVRESFSSHTNSLLLILRVTKRSLGSVEPNSLLLPLKIFFSANKLRNCWKVNRRSVLYGSSSDSECASRV
jgi:hypothetical protein